MITERSAQKQGREQDTDNIQNSEDKTDS